MENWSKIALFSPKMSQKAPRDPLGPPMTMKIIFLRCQDMKTIWQKKEFLVYLPQKKSWSDQTMRLAAILVFRRYGCRLHRNLAGEFTFFNQYYVLDHLKQKNGCSAQWGLTLTFRKKGTFSKKVLWSFFLKTIDWSIRKSY